MKSEDLFEFFPKLETDRLILGEFTIEDRQDVFEILQLPEVNLHETREPFTDIEQAENYVKARLFITKEKQEGIIWAIRLKDKPNLIGDIGYNPYQPYVAEVGFKLHPKYWGCGLISEALKAVSQFLFNETDTRRIEALTRPANIASEKVLIKNGFTKEGTLRQFQFYNDQAFDMNMFSLLKTEFKN